MYTSEFYFLKLCAIYATFNESPKMLWDTSFVRNVRNYHCVAMQFLII